VSLCVFSLLRRFSRRHTSTVDTSNNAFCPIWRYGVCCMLGTFCDLGPGQRGERIRSQLDEETALSVRGRGASVGSTGMTLWNDDRKVGSDGGYVFIHSSSITFLPILAEDVLIAPCYRRLCDLLGVRFNERRTNTSTCSQLDEKGKVSVRNIRGQCWNAGWLSEMIENRIRWDGPDLCHTASWGRKCPYSCHSYTLSGTL
jgi:hypothetical protein